MRVVVFRTPRAVPEPYFFAPTASQRRIGVPAGYVVSLVFPAGLLNMQDFVVGFAGTIITVDFRLFRNASACGHVLNSKICLHSAYMTIHVHAGYEKGLRAKST